MQHTDSGQHVGWLADGAECAKKNKAETEREKAMAKERWNELWTENRARDLNLRKVELEAGAVGDEDEKLDMQNDADNEATTSALALHALVGKLAHDLVGPLGTQLGYMDLLAPTCSGEEKNYLERARRQTSKLLDLVSEWRDGINAASEELRQPLAMQSAAQILGTSQVEGGADSIPAALVHAARLCVQWWSAQPDSRGHQASIAARNDEGQIELRLLGAAGITISETWSPDERAEPDDWSLYLARMILARAHGRLHADQDGSDLVLQLSVPI